MTAVLCFLRAVKEFLKLHPYTWHSQVHIPPMLLSLFLSIIPAFLPPDFTVAALAMKYAKLLLWIKLLLFNKGTVSAPPAKADALPLCISRRREEDSGHYLMSAGWTGTQRWVFSVTSPVEVLAKYQVLQALIITSCIPTREWCHFLPHTHHNRSTFSFRNQFCLYSPLLLIRVYWQQTLSEADCFDCMKLRS